MSRMSEDADFKQTPPRKPRTSRRATPPPQELQLSQDMAHLRRSWVAQRIGWAVMLLIIVAALAGAFGQGGPLSQAQATSDDGRLQVRYARVAHYIAPAELDIRLQPGPRATARIWVDNDYLDEVEITGITPPPSRSQLSGGRTLFEFPVDGNAPASVKFNLQMRSAGSLRGHIGMEASTVTIEQLVLP